MGLHPKMTTFRNAKHAKVFSKRIKDIERDLLEHGCNDYEIDVSSQHSHRSFLQRFLTSGYGDIEEVLSIEAHVYGCPVVIILPVGKGGFAAPYFINVMLPIPIHCTAEYHRGMLGGKWHLEPQNKTRITDLKHTIPTVKMKSQQTKSSHGCQIIWIISIAHELVPSKTGGTEWTINSAYEVGFRGMYPKIGKFLKTIPPVQKMLNKWSKEESNVRASSF